jgi:3'-phosphoadenosine 5'-phosphosulfate sulfotransferase (PAPS reductase)/FAD synthetase
MNPTIARLIARGATFVINHSGGKDSQAMTLYLRSIIPHDQLVIIHAELPEVDWEGIREHIAATAGDLPVHYCRSVSTFFETVERRGMFPSPKYRQCTSDLKRTPIERTIRRLGCKLIVNCMGLRAEESASRAKLETLKLNTRNSKAGREWYDWLPLHDWSTAKVFATIAAAGQQPHWAYAAGMTRLSCCFCIMASRGDLQTAARLKPDLFRRYVATERRLDQTLMMPQGGQRRFLDEIVGADPLPLAA